MLNMDPFIHNESRAYLLCKYVCFHCYLYDVFLFLPVHSFVSYGRRDVMSVISFLPGYLHVTCRTVIGNIQCSNVEFMSYTCMDMFVTGFGMYSHDIVKSWAHSLAYNARPWLQLNITLSTELSRKIIFLFALFSRYLVDIF
ncbi:hypothetical protein QTP88_014125 [Uroleucon formosanum]